MNMKNRCLRNVRKHIEIKGSDEYVTLDIPLKFDSLDKMIITFSDSKVKLGRSGKGFITSMGTKAKTIPKKYKKLRYDIGNVSKKDLSNINMEFEKLPHGSYEKKRPKHEPTDSYLYLSRQIAKCMMRADALN